MNPFAKEEAEESPAEMKAEKKMGVKENTKADTLFHKKFESSKGKKPFRLFGGGGR